MDDYPVILENTDILSLANFLENANPGRPVRELTYLLDYKLFGFDAAAWKWQDHFWHALCGYLVYHLGRRVGLKWQGALTAAAVFLLHPIAVEVAANSSHRKDSLALAFFLLATIVWARMYTAPSAAQKIVNLVLASCLAVFAVMAKQNAVVLPLILLVYELAFVPLPKRILWQKRWTAFWALSFLSGGLIWWCGWYLPSPEFQNSYFGALAKLNIFHDQTSGLYFMAMLKGWGIMMAGYVWPYFLSMEYIFSLDRGWYDLYIWGGLLAAIAWMFSTLYFLRQDKRIFFALAFFGGLWLPTSNLFFNTAYFAADRYVYAPSVGLALLIGIGLQPVLTRRAGILCCCLLLFTLGWQTVVQSGYWTNPQTFYERMLEISPDSDVGHVGLAQFYLQTGQIDSAEAHYLLAQELKPGHQKVYEGLGVCALKKGDLTRAIEYFKRALKVNPKAVNAQANLGLAYLGQGDFVQAENSFHAALEIEPNFVQAFLGLSVIYMQRNDPGRAINILKRATAVTPDDFQVYLKLGNAYYLAGQKREATTAYKKVLTLVPDCQPAVNNFALLSASFGEYKQAYLALEKAGKAGADYVPALRARIKSMQEKQLLKSPN